MDCIIEECSKEVDNSHYKLCKFHNQERLKTSKKTEDSRMCYSIDKGSKSLTAKKKTKTRDSRAISFIVDSVRDSKPNSNLLKDEELYLKVFNLSDHKCEECECDLPTEFRDDEGRVVARWRYSHIIPKSIAPELRHDVENINNLCINDHQLWENGDKTKMKIFTNNLAKFPNYLNHFIFKNLAPK